MDFEKNRREKNWFLRNERRNKIEGKKSECGWRKNNYELGEK